MSIAAANYREHPITFLLIASNVLFFIVSEAVILLLDADVVRYYASFNSNEVLAGEWWRVLSSIFLHANFMHLIFNSIALLIFGSILEKTVGHVVYLLTYIFSGILANILILLLASSYVSLGASGAIMGIIGCLFTCGVYLYSKTRNNIWKVYFTQMMIIIVLQVVIDSFIPNNSMLTHILGVISGMLMGVLVILLKAYKRIKLDK